MLAFPVIQGDAQMILKGYLIILSLTADCTAILILLPFLGSLDSTNLMTGDTVQRRAF